MFCPNCGAKALDNAEFCQSCGAKLIVGAEEKKQPETSAWQTQVQPRQYPTGAPEKKKGKKWPIILGVAGVLLCLLVILAVMGGNDSFKNQSQENSTGVDLSETYTNEEEGISFKYPSGWKPLSEEEIYSRFGSLEDEESYYSLVMLANENDDKPEENIYMEIAKFDATPQDINDFFADDEKSVSIFDDDTFVQDNSIIEIDGVTTRRITYIKGDEIGGQDYFYAVGSTVYRIDFSYIWEFVGDKQKFFDAIIGSYKITPVETAGTDDADVESDLAQEDSPPIDETQTIEEQEGELGGYYTDYLLWCGEYADGWMDTSLIFELYSDGSQGLECGYITTNFRGNETTGKLYYLGGNEFQWEQEGYSPTTYYIYTIENEAGYQLDFYNSDEEYEVTFTQYQQYIS